MKVAIVLPDGAADEPNPDLDGETPLAVAKTPHMDWVARHGRLGLAVNVPAGFTPGTDVATLSVFGYDPHRYYTGRAPIEAAAQGLTAGPDELIFRCNFVTVRDGRMADFTAGHIAQSETNALIEALNHLFADEPCRFHTGVSYRNLMIAGDVGDMDVRCQPPHDIPDRPVAEHLPRGRGAGRLLDLMDRAAAMIAEHAVNRVRRKMDHPPVTGIWLWGQGRPVPLEPFEQRFGMAGQVITAVDIIRGLAVMMGMKVREVPGATGFIDTNYAGKGSTAVELLAERDLVVVHVEAPDEAGHLGNAAEKIQSLERVDELIVGPLLEALRRHDDWRILIAPDHPTPVTTKAHSSEPPPFCYCGRGIEAVERRGFSEREAKAGGSVVDPGHELMTAFLGRAGACE